MSDFYICRDLLDLVLKWFTVETLLRCRCVCKLWKQLIDSAPFILDHLSVQRPRIILQNQNLEYLLLDPDNRPLYDTITGPDGVQPSSRILGLISCNLYAVGSVHGVICLYDNDDLLLLWNPSIRRHLSIPLPDFPPEWRDDFKHCGFWMDRYTRDFKVAIFQPPSFGPTGESIALYSSKNRAWVYIATNSTQIYPDFSSPQVLIDGVAYWSATDVNDYVTEYVVFFDFGRDEFGKIDLPKNQLSDWPVTINVSKWHGFLSILHTYGQPHYPHRLDLWVMQNGSWSKRMSFSLTEEIPEALCVLEDWGRVLASTRNGELVLYDREDEGYLRLRSRKDGYVPLNFKCVLSSSVHGIICLYHEHNIYLWNPSLRRLLNIPPPEFLARRDSFGWDYCGFWIDPSSNDYKVFVFGLLAKTLALFSSTKRLWIEAAMHNVEYYCGHKSRQEKFGTIKLPLYEGLELDLGSNADICKWQDSLPFVNWDWESPFQCDLWALQNGSWARMFSFNLVDEVAAVVYVVKSHGRVLAHSYKGELAFYDPNIGYIRLKSRFMSKSVAYDYVESLVFPDD